MLRAPVRQDAEEGKWHVGFSRQDAEAGNSHVVFVRQEAEARKLHVGFIRQEAEQQLTYYVELYYNTSMQRIWYTTDTIIIQ